MVFGDFNYNLLQDNLSITNYKTMLLENGLIILNNIDRNYCMRETVSTKTVLDHVSTNVRNNKFHVAIVESSMSDYKQIYVELHKHELETNKKIGYQAMDYDKLYKTVEQYQLKHYHETEYEELEIILMDAVNAAKIAKSKIQNPPRTDWLKRDIIEVVNKSNQLWCTYKYV